MNKITFTFEPYYKDNPELGIVITDGLNEEDKDVFNYISYDGLATGSCGIGGCLGFDPKEKGLKVITCVSDELDGWWFIPEKLWANGVSHD